jgi:Flp pilus assembly protein TadG
MSRDTERGSASIWALIVTAGAFTVLLGLVVDGGRLIDARLASARTAAQAARLGADSLSTASVRNGDSTISASTAVARARDYLRQAGMSGHVRVTGDRVTVTVTGTSQNQILTIVGLGSFPIQESQTAQAITEDDQP